MYYYYNGKYAVIHVKFYILIHDQLIYIYIYIYHCKNRMVTLTHFRLPQLH